MSFNLVWTQSARAAFDQIQAAAQSSFESRRKSSKTKASRQEGLYKQVVKCLQLLADNPRHPGLQTHEYSTIENPYQPAAIVFEAYAQNRTPGAYRIFWRYGPNPKNITIIAITSHP